MERGVWEVLPPGITGGGGAADLGDGRCVLLSEVKFWIGCPCPFCSRPMRLFRSDAPALELDACKTCGAVWFDPQEFETVPEGAVASTHEIQMRGIETFRATLEEVGTELSAQRIVNRLVPRAQLTPERVDDLGIGAYKEQVREVVRVVQEATGKSHNESTDLIVDSHYKGSLLRAGQYDSKYQVLQGFLEGLAVTDEQRQNISRGLLNSFRK
jgi:hypothetical protein